MKDLLKLVSWQWRHHRLAFAGGIALAMVPALAGIALLGVAGWFITSAAIAGVTGVLLNIFMPSAMIRGLAIARTLGRYGERLTTHDATFRFLTDLRRRIFAGQAEQAGNGTQTRSGVALNRLTSDITALDAVYLRLVVPGILAVLSGILSLIWIASLSPWLMLGPGIIAGFVLVDALVSFRFRKGQDARRQEAALDAVRLRTVDLVAGRRDLAVYGGMQGAADAIRYADKRLGDAEDLIETRSNLFAAWAGFAGQVSLAVTLVVVAWLATENRITVPLAISALLVVMALPEVLAALVPGLSNLGRLRLAARRAVHGVAPSDGGDLRRAEESVENGSAAPSDKAALSFRDVRFGYPGANRLVLSGLSFHVERQEWLAVVGRSGCGKSTVSGLAAGLLTPEQGEICLSGRPLDQWSEAELRQRITVIGQRPYLFNDTVAANLRIANASATDDELWKSLEMAALAARIQQNSLGLETPLGEGGLGLSGGEQRRLGLARAYLTRPDLFILDEFTEGLDASTAADVLAGFQSFRGSAAVLMIAHKPEEVAAADRVLRLDAASAGVASE